MIHGGPAWVSRPEHPNYVAAARAVEKVYGKPPDLTREGGSIPVANWLEDATGITVLLLPTSASNDGAHAQNEKWDKRNLVNAVKVLATYLHEISRLVGPCAVAKPGRGDAAANNVRVAATPRRTTWIVRGPRRLCLAMTRPADDPRRGRGVDATKPTEMAAPEFFRPAC